MRRTRRIGILVAGGVIAVAGLAMPVAWAQTGPHANARFIFHLEPSLEYSYGQSFEGYSTLRRCEDALYEGQVIEGDEIPAQVFFVLASFEDSPGPIDVAGVSFGFERYNTSAISIADHGLCNQGDLYLATSGWPGPNEGVSLIWMEISSHPRQRIVELAWFAAYVYAPVAIPLGRDPKIDSAGICTVSNPPECDEVLDYDLGILGFDQQGYNPCEPIPRDGACCRFGQCQLTSRESCEAQGGIFFGVNSACFPNPCDIPMKPTTWGRLKRFYEEY